MLTLVVEGRHAVLGKVVAIPAGEAAEKELAAKVELSCLMLNRLVEEIVKRVDYGRG